MVSRVFLRSALLVALLLPLLASGARAGVGDRAAEAVCAWERWTPIERAQYFFFDDEDYCWYDDGWHGPGWYWCGDEWNQGWGWGGPYGWNGWGGGYYIRRYRPHGIGVWHAYPPRRRLGVGGARATPGSPGGTLAAPRFGAGAGVHGRGGGQSVYGPGVVHGSQGPAAGGGFRGFGAPASSRFGGGGFGGFGGGGFHGGAFFGGHGGGGHR